MKRLYVLVSKKLAPVYGCVQGGHAVAQYLLDHPRQTWDNNYLIYLYADIEKWLWKLKLKNIDFSVFREPDLDNEITAIAVRDDAAQLFKDLDVVR